MADRPKMRMADVLARLTQIEDLTRQLREDLAATRPAAAAAKQAPPPAPNPKAKPAPPNRAAAARALRGQPEPEEYDRGGDEPVIGWPVPLEGRTTRDGKQVFGVRLQGGARGAAGMEILVQPKGDRDPWPAVLTEHVSDHKHGEEWKTRRPPKTTGTRGM